MNRRRRTLLAAAGGGAALAAARAFGVAAPESREPLERHLAPGDSLQALIDGAPADGRRCRVHLPRGRWHERIVVTRPGVELVGAGRDASVITHDRAAGHPGADGRPLGTWGCATVTVRAPGFRARRLTIENAFDYPGHLAAPRLETVGANGAQAVALMLDAGSDHASLDEVALWSHQDTLFADAGRATLRRCLVAGSVDFVFGAAQARFEHCEIRSRFRPGKPRQGYIVAPSTRAAQAQGLLFVDCRLTREPDVPDRSVALGRAWRPTRRFADGQYGDPQAVGAAALLRCWMDAHVDPCGWEPMAYTARDSSRAMLAPADARFGEWRSRGPGAAARPACAAGAGYRPRLDERLARRLLAGRERDPA